MPQYLPQKFVESLVGVQGFSQEAFVAVHENPHAITSIRLNADKPSQAIDQLRINSIVPWCSTGRYLSQRPSFTLDPVFHAGAYYVQEASSMFLDHAIKHVCGQAEEIQRVLDLCAAPGGKSTLLAAALPQSLVVSNEVIKTRVGVLAENVSKWGSDHVIVTNNDPKDFKKFPGYFDLLVIDAPCSGSGLFRKDTNAIDEWSESGVEMCSQRQRRIITDSIGCLKQNGYLFYSTCSYSAQENEDVCDWIIETFGLEPLQIPIESSWGIVETQSPQFASFGYRFYPDKVKGEGFFFACFKQVREAESKSFYSSRSGKLSKRDEAIITPFIKNPANYHFTGDKEIVIAIPKQWEDDVSNLTNVLNVRKSGIAVGTIKGNDLIPHHELSLSTLLNIDITAIDVDLEGALKYLRRQDLAFSSSHKGWAVIRYGDIVLGWVKVLPNRVNNYYPTNWRILKT